MVLPLIISSSYSPNYSLLARTLALTALILVVGTTAVLLPQWWYDGLLPGEYKHVGHIIVPPQEDDGPCPAQARNKSVPEYPREAFVNCTLLRRKNEPLMNTGFVKSSPIVIESHKLLLFYVRKVASREFISLARRMLGLSGWNKTCRFLDDGLTSLYDYSPDQAEALVLSDEWTRAIFVRDPKERLLSAYLNKVEQPQFFQQMCCHRDFTTPILNTLLQCHNNTITKLNLSFTDFVEHVVTTCPNLHWIPQSQLLRPKEWNTIDFVGHFNRLEHDGRRLLERVGAWQEYGASGWAHGSLFHHGAVSSVTTRAKDRLHQYYTPELEKRVDAIYKSDYNLKALNLTRYKIFQDDTSA